jgi:hypothetical protein
MTSRLMRIGLAVTLGAAPDPRAAVRTGDDSVR